MSLSVKTISQIKRQISKPIKVSVPFHESTLGRLLEFKEKLFAQSYRGFFDSFREQVLSNAQKLGSPRNPFLVALNSLKDMFTSHTFTNHGRSGHYDYSREQIFDALLAKLFPHRQAEIRKRLHTIEAFKKEQPIQQHAYKVVLEFANTVVTRAVETLDRLDDPDARQLGENIANLLLKDLIFLAADPYGKKNVPCPPLDNKVDLYLCGNEDDPGQTMSKTIKEINRLIAAAAKQSPKAAEEVHTWLSLDVFPVIMFSSFRDFYDHLKPLVSVAA